MELVNFDVPILVFVDLVEAILEGQPSLHQNLDQMVEDFVLSVALATLALHLRQLLDIVCVVEFFKFLKLDQA